MGDTDEESAWIDAARAVNKIWRHPKTKWTVFISSCTAALTAAALYTGTYYTPTADVIVYCFIYSMWLTLCLPWLVKYLDKKMLLLVAGVLVRLFAAEAGVLVWGLLRGHGHFLQRVLRQKPLLEPSLMWLAEAGYNLRYGVIVSSVVAATLATLSNFTQHFNQKWKNCSTNSSSSRDADYPSIADSQAKTRHRRSFAPAGEVGSSENEQSRWAGVEKPSADRAPCLCGRRNECSSLSPELANERSCSNSPRKSDKNRRLFQSRACDTREETGDGVKTLAVQKSCARSCDSPGKRSGFGNDSSDSSKNSTLSAGHVGKTSPDLCRGLRVGNLITVQEKNIGLDDKYKEIQVPVFGALRNNRIRQSSSCFSSVTTDQDRRRERRKRWRGQRSGRRSCPTAIRQSYREGGRQLNSRRDGRVLLNSGSQTSPKQKAKQRPTENDLKTSVCEGPAREPSRRETSGYCGRSYRAKCRGAGPDSPVKSSKEKDENHNSDLFNSDSEGRISIN
ncbi:hypothetical protein PoB_003874100 [Plakobranchus ocellatus]|uniref:Uncharacterized protein n=1 Tax=Plakobranchus ocellatus TaxID=259542 RepID=A0AAV4AM48_9GAST|nr:hypothetical protein PoB_003874100 [Plakobranchus ocellatus]